VTLGELVGICARRVGALEGWTRMGVGVGDISLRFCGVKVCFPSFLPFLPFRAGGGLMRDG